MPHVNYFWDEIEDNVVHEYDGENKSIANYTTEPKRYGPLLCEDRNSVKRYHHVDGQGNVTELTNETGNITDSSRQSAFGTTTTSVGETPSPWRWGGQRQYYH